MGGGGGGVIGSIISGVGGLLGGLVGSSNITAQAPPTILAPPIEDLSVERNEEALRAEKAAEAALRARQGRASLIKTKQTGTGLARDTLRLGKSTLLGKAANG